MSYSDIEQMQRRLEEGLNRSLQLLEDLEIGIGDVQQKVRLLRQSGGGGGCGTIEVTVRLCSTNALISGAVVTIKDSLGATVGSGTTGAPGIVTIPITAAGTYTVEVVKTGQETVKMTVVATCTTNAVTALMGRLLTVTVKGCNSFNYPGATVTATLSGVSTVGTTNGSGQVILSLQATGTYSLSVTEPTGRFATFTTTVSVTTCTTTTTVNLLVATGYHCQDWESAGGTGNRDCLLPLADTLFLTDSVYGGPTTLTWNTGSSAWLGSKLVTYPACGLCTHTGTATLRYALARVGGAGSALGLQYSAGGLGCPTDGAATQVNATAVVPPNGLTCPAAFSATFSYTPDGFFNMFCSGPAVTFTITE
jgi:hypothetical protein